MPIIDVSIAAGRSPETTRRLISALTEATSQTLGCDPEIVRVLIREIPTTHWAAGDRTLEERVQEARERKEE